MRVELLLMLFHKLLIKMGKCKITLALALFLKIISKRMSYYDETLHNYWNI